MRSLLYIIAVILVISWVVGYFAYSATGLIHILLVIAIISLLLGVIQGRSV
jgi:predicted ferric reductase